MRATYGPAWLRARKPTGLISYETEATSVSYELLIRVHIWSAYSAFSLGFILPPHPESCLIQHEVRQTCVTCDILFNEGESDEELKSVLCLKSYKTVSMHLCRIEPHFSSRHFLLPQLPHTVFISSSCWWLPAHTKLSIFLVFLVFLRHPSIFCKLFCCQISPHFDQIHLHHK